MFKIYNLKGLHNLIITVREINTQHHQTFSYCNPSGFLLHLSTLICFLLLYYPFLQLYVNGIRQHMLFCLALFSQQNYSGMRYAFSMHQWIIPFLFLIGIPLSGCISLSSMPMLMNMPAPSRVWSAFKISYSASVLNSSVFMSKKLFILPQYPLAFERYCY